MYIPNLFELVFTAQAARDRRWTLGRRGKVEIRSQKVKGGTGVQEVAQVRVDIQDNDIEGLLP